LNEPAKAQSFTFDDKSLESFKRGFDVKALEQPDGVMIFTFEDLIDGGVFRMIRKFDEQTRRYQVDGEVLALEASLALTEQLRQRLETVHLHQNLKVFESYKKDPSQQFDAIIHGDIKADNNDNATFAIVMEAKTKVHENDFERVLQKANTFTSYLNASQSLSCTTGFNPDATKSPFNHFSNVKVVVPCLAGRHFPAELVDSCYAKGILPVFPSGSRYTSKMVKMMSKFFK
jgi:hypothetical protein